MTKKFLSLLLAIVMICAMGAIPVSAATTTLQELIDAAAAGATIKLEKDYVENLVTITKSITLDLNGYSLYTNNNNQTLIVSGTNVEVVITDNSDSKAGSIKQGRVGTTSAAVTVKNGAKVTLAGGSVIANEYGVIVTGGAEFTMNAGNVEGNYGVRVLDSGKFTLNGGVVQAVNAGYGVYPRGNVTVEIP